MRKILLQPMAFQRPARRSIYLTSLHARPYGCSGGFLSFQHGIVQPPYPRWSSSHKYRPGQVAAITAEYSTLVQDDQFVFPERLASGPGMSPGGTRSRGNNSLKRRSAPTLLLYGELDLRSQTYFGDPRLNFRDDRRKYLADKGRRILHQGQLTGVFNGPQPFY